MRRLSEGCGARLSMCWALFVEASGYSLLTAIGLALGFARELTVASTFGLSPQLDVFVAIMTLQLFFGAQIGNALETVFIARAAKKGGVVTVTRELKPALCGLLLVNLGVVLFLLASGGFLVHSIFPRFDAAQATLGVQTLHFLTAPIVFASTAGLLRGALSVLGAFAPGFVAGSIISLCSIVSITLWSESLGIDALTAGRGNGKLARHAAVCSSARPAEFVHTLGVHTPGSQRVVRALGSGRHDSGG